MCRQRHILFMSFINSAHFAMIKNLYLTIMLAGLALTAQAAPRSLQQKLTIAWQVLQQRQAQGAKAQAGATPTLRELQAGQGLSVYGLDGGGFVVVSNDDGARPVVGYSTGTFDTDGNASLRWFLQAAEEALAAAAPRKVVAPSQYEGVKEEVQPLVATTWNQGSPYNLYTPTYGNNRHYATGCVATAMAQVMNFHEYPARGQNTHTYTFTPTGGQSQKLTVDYSQETYDWSLMVDNYTGLETDEQKQEVAKLMYDAGVACSMQYNEDGSGAYTYEAANALVEYFNYNANLQLYSREAYSEQLWMKIIYDELNQKRPIMYAGYDASSGGGHEFVLDGYDAEGRVHINWGWGGSADGYFDIALLNPSGYQFSLGQEMVMGVAPPETAIPADNELYVNGDISFIALTSTANAMGVSGSATNTGRRRFQGPIALLVRDEAGADEVVTYFSSSSRRGSDTPVSYDLFHGNSTSLSLRTVRYGDILAGKADGTYRFYVASQNADGWSPVHATGGKVNSVVVTKSGDTYTFATDTDDLWMASSAGVATAIATLPAATTGAASQPATLYNLAGQRVGQGYKGVVVTGGRKVLVK